MPSESKDHVLKSATFTSSASLLSNILSVKALQWTAVSSFYTEIAVWSSSGHISMVVYYCIDAPPIRTPL